MFKKIVIPFLALIFLIGCNAEPTIEDLEKEANKIDPSYEETTVVIDNAFLIREKNENKEWIDTKLDGSYIEKSEIKFNEEDLTPFISVKFNEEGTKLFEEITTRNIDKSVGVFVNGELITAPIVNETITGGEAQIQGNFSLEEAKEMNELFNKAALLDDFEKAQTEEL